MSIYFSGTKSKSGGILSAIMKQLKIINLKPLKTVEVNFDPFHPKSVVARDFLFHITTNKVQETNFNCKIKTNIVCDRSVPFIKAEFADSEKTIKFLADNLTVLDILVYFNKHISSTIKPEAVSAISTIIQKLEKKKNIKHK